jgi:hypothetical protein
MQDHNNDPARNRRTGRLNANKAVRDLSNAHGHNNRHVRASITHVRDKVVVVVVVVPAPAACATSTGRDPTITPSRGGLRFEKQTCLPTHPRDRYLG